METLRELSSDGETVLYELKGSRDRRIKVYVASTPYTREVCTNSLLVTPEFEDSLKKGIGEVIYESALRKTVLESAGGSTDVDFLNILRGGSNFDPSTGLYRLGLRTTRHFVSSQRRQLKDGSWKILQDSYEKLFCEDTEKGRNINLFFGDIVATGTSLKKGLQKTIKAMENKEHKLGSLYFFTIGGINTEKIFEEVLDLENFGSVIGSANVHIIYLEGRFGVATEETPINPKTPDTDLLVYHEKAIITPELARSLLEEAANSLEACVIYDGGKRANSWKMHLKEVEEHWTKMKTRAEEGLTLYEAVNERFPVLDLSTREEWTRTFPAWGDLSPEKIDYLAKLRDLTFAPSEKKELVDISNRMISKCQRILRGER